MRVFPVQQKVLPGLVKGAKTLPKEVAAIGTAATAAASAVILGGKEGKVNCSPCGSTEDYCIPLLSF